MPNSLAMNIGRPGFDQDGVQRIIARADGSYQLTNVWKTLQLWMADNGCALLMPMWSVPTVAYDRFDAAAHLATIDEDRYAQADQVFYRDSFKARQSNCLRMQSRILEAEAKAFVKLWSLCDERLVTNMRSDGDYDHVVHETKLPMMLRTLIVDTVNRGAGNVGATSKDHLRDEWSNWAMEYTTMTLYNYRLAWIDFISRSTAATLDYTPEEMAAKFVKGLSYLWAEKQAALSALVGAARMQTVDAAYEELLQWERARIEVYGSISPGAASGSTYAAYTVEETKTWKQKKLTWQAEKAKADAKAAGKDAKPGEDAKTGDAGAKSGFKGSCHNCHGRGHKADDCPSAKGMFSLTISRMGIEQEQSRTVLLDGGAEASLFHNCDLLSDFVTVPAAKLKTFMAGSEQLSVEQAALYHGVRVYTCSAEQCGVNILSESNLKSLFKLYPLDGWGTRAVCKRYGTILDFVFEGTATRKLDVDQPVRMDIDLFRELFTEECRKKAYEIEELQSPGIFTVAVSDKARLFTVKERERAVVARRYVRNSGFRGMGKLLKSLNKMTGVTITAQDVRNQAFIYGPDRAVLKGRSRDSAAPLVSPDVKPLMLRTAVKIQADVMEFLGEKFIVCMLRPNSLAVMVHVTSLTAAVLNAGLLRILSTCHSMQMHASEIVIDPDRALFKASRMLEGVPVLEVGVGDHVVDAENLIQVLKNIMRCVLHAQPWNFPPSLVPMLGEYAVRRRNAQEVDATGEIPLETVSGEKVHWVKEFDLGFGDAVEVYIKPKKTNQAVERTVAAIALRPVGRIGSWRVRFLDTWTDGSTRRAHLVDTDEKMVEFMNKRCESERPSAAYRTALKMEMDIPLEGAEDEEPGPRVVEAEVPLPLMEEEENGLPEENLEAEDLGNGDQETVDDAVNVVGGIGDQVWANPNPGDDGSYHMAMVLEEGRASQHISHFMGSMRKGSTKSSLKAALSKTGGRGDRAMLAAIAELRQIDDKGSWHPVKRSTLSRQELRGIVRTFMFVIDKFTPDGALLKVKARLVAMGNMQDPDGISMDTSAPTVDITSVLTMAAIAAAEGRHKMTCDVAGAFLHTVWPKKQGRQYVHLDKVNARILCQIRPEYWEFVNSDGGMVLELDRALYGLVQSARLWYDRLVGVLSQNGYVANPMDPCVWNKGEGAEQCSVLFHVDDLSCSSVVLEHLKSLEALLVSEFGLEHIKCVFGDDQDYLGMRFLYTDNKVHISMEGYLQAVLDYAGLTGSETAKTPANNHLFTLKEGAAKLNAEQNQMFHSVVQGLSYASQRVRWDLLLVVSFLKSRVSCPDEFDWQKLMRALAYLNATKKLGLTLGVTGGAIAVDSSIDASHAVHENGRSQGGLAISLGLGVVKARSHKLGLNTKSSMESELVTTSDNTTEVVWIQEFLMAQGYKMAPAVVRQDNQATMLLLERGRSDSKRTKHINTRFFFVHDRLSKGELTLEWTPTEEMVADFFTKPLQGALFLKMRDKLLGVSGFAP
jgi:hypothetical protein